MDINQLIDELPGDNSASTSTVEAETVHSGPCCDKCGAPIVAKESLVCQKCGWYASIGSYVEIDRSWEVATDPSLATEEDTKPEPEAGLPPWSYILMGCLVAVLVESVAARFITGEGSSARTFWALAQLFLGFVAYAICHTFCFILMIRDEAEIKLMDFILRPIKLWSGVFRGMPKRGWVCYAGLSGLFAAALAMLVIGGIPYERLLDWNIKEKAKFNLIGAIAEQANQIEEEEKSMEEALGEFADKAGADDLDKNAKPKREKQDCIIIGYMANRDGEIQTLLLAAEYYAKLKYAGNVRLTDLPEADIHELTRNLVKIKTHRPFVKVSVSGATWVKPKYLCRVSYRRRGKQGGLFGAKIEDLLGEVDLNRKP